MKLLSRTLLFGFATLTLIASFSLSAQRKWINEYQEELAKDPQDTALVDVLNFLSQAYYPIDSDSVLFFAEQALAYSDEIGYVRGRSYAFHHMAIYHSWEGKYDTAMVYYEKSLAIKEAIRDTVSIPFTLNNMGGIYYQQGNYAKALFYYQRSLKLKIANGWNEAVSGNLNNIGLIYLKQKNYDQALDYLNRALEMKRKASYGPGQASTLQGIGLVYLNQKKYEEAITWFSQAYHMYDSLGEKCDIVTSALNLGESFFELDQMQDARNYLQQAYDRAVKCKNQLIVSQSLLILGKIYAKEGRLQVAEEAMLESYRFSDSNDLKEKASNAAEELYKFYRAKGDISKALEFIEIEKKLRETLFNEELTEELTRLELNHAFDMERDSLEFQKKAELLTVNTRLERQRVTQYITIFVLLIAIIFGFVVYRYYRLSQKAKSGLQKKNEIISEALEEREVLLKEIHHRVKNNLQVVSSLLNIQSKYLGDQPAQKAVLEGRDRVQSMALVHEKLYQSDNLSQLNVKEYLEELVVTLFQSYDVSEDRVQLKSEIGAIHLSIDLTMQIGLIINELISNALKYAFPAGRNGSIHLVFKKNQEVHELEVSDDGIGISEPEDLKRSYGYRIIQSISRGLNGKISMQYENGTAFKLSFTG
ncbi:MAG: tetratricopeptide repeat protein [Bacteroidota bacterium]